MNREAALALAKTFLADSGLIPDPAVVWENDQVFVIGYGLPGWVNDRDPADMIVDDQILVVYKATDTVRFEHDDLVSPAHADLVEVAA